MQLTEATTDKGRLLEPARFEHLKGQLRGTLLRPGEPSYDDARRLWNGMVDKRPIAIARCTNDQDVRVALAFACETGLTVAVRGGGHSIAGASCCDGGLMIDLSGMKAIKIDPVRRVARAEPGVLLGEFDAATQRYGLATTMGVNSDTGIAGLTLGGGLGRLGRSVGLACDNLLAAEVVVADGRLLRATEKENSDLLWGLRGGGGNFGIVTAFEYRLHPVGPTVLGGMLLWEWSAARDAMRHYAAFCAVAPDDVDALGVLLTGPDGAPAFAVSAFCAGSIERGEETLRPLREAGPRPAQDMVGPVTYTALQASADGLFPRGRRYHWKSHFLPELRAEAIDVLIRLFEDVPSRMSVIGLQQAGGAIARVSADATAYSNRDAVFDCIPISIWEDAAQDAANIAWSRRVWEAMKPFATGGVYVNNLGDEGEARIRAAYGDNYARLAALKAKYDPSNLFRLNQNIRPAA
ncbi:FAD-binding oxidoreductase [Falsiroseomonas sp. E2-1-a20]|uniref:FAD-binding oxidoreductase n=1 Tax=Falsiroseomonas sp. E2-1-a20 TaxID=3239300 RepID=UPI003F3960A7